MGLALPGFANRTCLVWVLAALLFLGGCDPGGAPASPLAEAVVTHDLERVRQLVNSGEDANAPWMGRPLLALALADGQPDIAQALFDGGARVDAEIDGVGMVDAFYRDGDTVSGAWLEAHGAIRKP